MICGAHNTIVFDKTIPEILVRGIFLSAKVNLVTTIRASYMYVLSNLRLMCTKCVTIENELTRTDQ